MNQPLKISHYESPPAGGGWREIGQIGWQYAWHTQLVRDGLWAKLKGSQVSVLGVLLAHANTQGHAWPRPTNIIEMSGQSERSVQLAISHLASLGLIERRSADEYVDRPYIAFLRRSSWTTDERVMASTHDAPVQPQSRRQAQQNAPEAQPSAPQAQPRAPEAQPVAPRIYRNGTRQEHTSSSGAPAPIARSRTRSEPQPGLFDDDVVVSMLEKRGFRRGNAISLIETYTRDRLKEAIAHCDIKREEGQAKGKPIKNYCGFLTHFLKNDMTADPAAIPKEEPTPIDHAKEIKREMKRCKIRRPWAEDPECMDFAKGQLGWKEDKWQAALKAMEGLQ